MAGRGPQTFKKRQKEQQRKEKQQEKLARRLQRKHDALHGITTEDTDENGDPLYGPPLDGGETAPDGEAVKHPAAEHSRPTEEHPAAPRDPGATGE